MNLDSMRAALAGRYRLERELGQGGMATVYLAEDLKHDRRVAVKVLRPELAAVLGADRFVQEIKTTASLQHPHILPLFDSGEADGFLYYVMPYIEGETLRDKLNRETQLGIEEAVRITTEVADALDYAHRHGVIHRDIKPENILLHDGRPMVADFGIALAVSAAAGGRMTETGLSLGTPHYMSPEQATAEKEITARSDVYSLASVLYEMLAGQPPHLGGSAQQIIMKIIAEPVAVVTSLRKSVPANVTAALSKALEKLPADRFASAKAFADALTDPGFVTVAAGRVSQASRVRASTSGLLVAGVVVLALLAAWGWLRPGPSEPASPWRTTLTLPDTIGLYEGLDISRDGSVVVFGSAGTNPIMVRRAGADGFVPIPGTAGGTWPAISPDGRRVALLSHRLLVTSIDGGTPTLLTEGTSLSSQIVWQDDDHVIFSRLSGLVRVATAGGAVEQVTTVDAGGGEAFHLGPDVLPTGGVVFVTYPVGNLDAAAGRIAAVGPGGGHHVVLMEGHAVRYAHPDHLLVGRNDGSIVAVPFDPAALRVTGAPVPVLGGMRIGIFSTVGQFAVSPNGRLVVVTRGGVSVGLSEPVRVTRGAAVSPVRPGWVEAFQTIALSPDSRSVAVGLFRSTGEEIEVRNLSSGAVQRIAVPGAQLRVPAFSRDGRWLLVTGLGPGITGVYRMPLRSAGAPERWLSFDERKGFPGTTDLSPDGRTVYYMWRSATSVDIRFRAVGDTAGDEQVIVPSGQHPAVSPDGRWLAYRSTESGRGGIWVRSTDPARSERWPISGDVPLKSSQARWSPDGREVLFLGTDSLWATSVSGGAGFTVGARRGLVGSGPFVSSSFAVFPNGDLLMLRNRPGGGATELTMIEDWHVALGQERE